MTTKLVPAADLIAEWNKDPTYRAAYDELQEEFALAAAMIEARAQAALTQAEVARRMGTTQAVVARLESGRGLPSTRTLMRYAAATGTQLRVSFAPAPRPKRRAARRSTAPS